MSNPSPRDIICPAAVTSSHPLKIIAANVVRFFPPAGASVTAVASSLLASASVPSVIIIIIVGLHCDDFFKGLRYDGLSRDSLWR